MEEPETIYCEVLDSQNDIKPSPPPLPKREDKISASFTEEQISLKRIHPLRSINFITKSCQRCRKNSSSKKLVVLSITVAIFAILTVVFMTLYFTNEAKCITNDCNNSSRSVRNVCKHCSVVSNCSSFTNKSQNEVSQNCSIVNNCSSCPKKNHNEVSQNCSIVSNCSSLPNRSHNDVSHKCSNVSNWSGISKNTSNNASKCTDCNKLKTDLEKKKLAYVALRCINCSEYSVLFHRKSTEDYVISKGASQMTATTVCFWIKTWLNQDAVIYLSYALDKGRDNEFGIRTVSSNLDLFMNNNAPPHIRPSEARVINDGKWHAICASWSSKSGESKIYKDGNLVHEVLRFQTGEIIPGGGTWVLGHDQDEVGGGFEVDQMMQGEMTEANIWDRVFSDEEIKSFSTSCQFHLKGNVKSWNDFLSGVKGKVAIVEKPTCCNA